MDWSTDTVTLVNRDSKEHVVTWDGKTVTFKPHEERQVPPIVADVAIQQHPIMGTEDPGNPRDFQSLFGVRQWDKWDCSPITQSDAPERFDVSLLPPDRQVGRQVVSTGRKGYHRSDVSDAVNDPAGAGFRGDTLG